MYSLFDSAVVALILASSVGLAFIAQKMALTFLLKAMSHHAGSEPRSIASLNQAA